MKNNPNSSSNLSFSPNTVKMDRLVSLLGNNASASASSGAPGAAGISTAFATSSNAQQLHPSGPSGTSTSVPPAKRSPPVCKDTSDSTRRLGGGAVKKDTSAGSARAEEKPPVAEKRIELLAETQ